MTTKRPRPWWASPCAGGTPYPDREEAELFGAAFFCGECGAYHARGDDWRADPAAGEARMRALSAYHDDEQRRRDEARPAPPDDAGPPF